jgi:hypothetical protein
MGTDRDRSSVLVQRAHSPATKIVINLEQFTDRMAEDGPQSPDIVVKEHPSEPECFELRSECGFAVLNKGEMKKAAHALLELADSEDLGSCWICRLPLTRPAPGRIGCLRCDDSMTDAEVKDKMKELERMSKLMEAVKKLDGGHHYELRKGMGKNPWIACYPGDAHGNSSPTFEEMLLSLAGDL